MKTKFEAKLKMFLALRIFLRSNPTILKLLPNVEEFLTNLDAAILQIQNNNELLQHHSTGDTVNNNKLRSDLLTNILDDSRKIHAFAKYANNISMMTDTKYTLSDLKTASDIELLNIAKSLSNIIDSNLINLTQYKLTTETQTLFKNNIKDFEDSIPLKRQKQVEKKENMNLINQGFANALTAVKNIDDVVEIIHINEPSFYSSYKEIRKVIGAGGSSLVLKGKITDSETNEPIEDATITFYLPNSNQPLLIKHSSVKGGFTDKTLSEGELSVTTLKVGYNISKVTITIDYSRINTLIVKLVKNTTTPIKATL
jgi:hypothetical protein